MLTVSEFDLNNNSGWSVVDSTCRQCGDMAGAVYSLWRPTVDCTQCPALCTEQWSIEHEALSCESHWHQLIIVHIVAYQLKTNSDWYDMHLHSLKYRNISFLLHACFRSSPERWSNKPGKNVCPSVRLSVHTSTMKHSATTNQIVVFVKVDETFLMMWLSRSSEVRVRR